MSHEIGEAKQVISDKKARLIALLLASFIVLYFLIWIFSGGNEFQDNRGHSQISVIEKMESSKIIEVPLDPETWSDWVELPLTFKNWELRAPDWLEFRFLNGESHRLKADEKFWWKNTPCRTFKLRGATGKATIVVKL